MMNALGTPFSCPICFEDYDGVEFNPATLICGHSCCITHVDLLNKKCYNCRQPFDPKSTHISYALRDGSILYTTMKDRMNGLRLASKPINIDIPIIPIANAPTTANLKSDIKSDADRPPSAPSAPSAPRLTTSTQQQQLMHYKMTSNINSSGNKVRSGPSFDNEQIASIEWRKFNNDTILIDEVIQVSNGAMWGRLSPSHYPVLRSTYNFKVHDPEQAWVIISTPTKTNYFTLVTPSTLTGLTPTSPVRIKNRYKLTSEVPRGM